MNRIFSIILVLCFVISCTGCTSSSDEQLQMEQTIWQLLDEEGNLNCYLNENDEDVVQIMELIEKHVEAVDNRSYNDLNYEDEKNTYSDAFQAVLENSEYEDKLHKMYEQNELEISSVSILWNPSTINSDRTSCKIDIDSVFTFKSGLESYLSSLGVSLQSNYAEHRIYYCEKTDDGWLISNIEKSAIAATN